MKRTKVEELKYFILNNKDKVVLSLEGLLLPVDLWKEEFTLVFDHPFFSLAFASQLW